MHVVRGAVTGERGRAKTRFRFVVGIIAVTVLAFAGCGHRAAQKPASTPAVSKVTIPLPEWAPKNPSPDFLRAARVLKPLPDELLQGIVGKSAEGEALLQRYRGTMPASYEFFGTLDDRQIERLRTTHEIRIPAKALTPKQRAALNHWFEDWRAAMKGMRPELEDFLVSIYKTGGREDLSNVDVGFTAVSKEGGHIVAGHLVQIYFWVKQPGGKVIDLGTAFAQI